MELGRLGLSPLSRKQLLTSQALEADDNLSVFVSAFWGQYG